MMYLSVFTGIAQEADQRSVVRVNEIEELSESSLPGFIKVSYQKPGIYWQEYFLHIPVSAIEQVNVEPKITRIYLKLLKLPEIIEEGPVELVIPHNVRSSEDLLKMFKRVVQSAQGVK